MVGPYLVIRGGGGPKKGNPDRGVTSAVKITFTSSGQKKVKEYVSLWGFWERENTGKELQGIEGHKGV